MDSTHHAWRRSGVGLAVASLAGFALMSNPVGATSKATIPAGLSVKSFDVRRLPSTRVGLFSAG